MIANSFFFIINQTLSAALTTGDIWKFLKNISTQQENHMNMFDLEW